MSQTKKDQNANLLKHIKKKMNVPYYKIKGKIKCFMIFVWGGGKCAYIQGSFYF